MRHKPLTSRLKYLILVGMIFGLVFESGTVAYALSEEQSRITHSGILYFSFEELEVREGGNVTGGVTGPLNGCNNAQKIWNYFTQIKKLPPAVAAGFLGNMQEEAHFEPRQMEIAYSDAPHLSDDVPPSVNSKGQPGFGIIQWTSQGRKDGLAALATGRGVKAGTLEVQMDYVWQELNSGYKSSTLDPLLADPNIAPQAASEIITRNYEVPGSMSSAITRRKGYAQHWFTVFTTGQACGAIGAGSGSTI